MEATNSYEDDVAHVDYANAARISANKLTTLTKQSVFAVARGPKAQDYYPDDSFTEVRLMFQSFPVGKTPQVWVEVGTDQIKNSSRLSITQLQFLASIVDQIEVATAELHLVASELYKKEAPSWFEFMTNKKAQEDQAKLAELTGQGSSAAAAASHTKSTPFKKGTWSKK